MNFRGQGSFEYVLMIAGVVLVLTVIVVVLQNQATGSSQAVEQNVEYHAKVACDSAKARERAQSLVFSWNFNEGSGTVAADSSGNNNDGTLTNGPKWTTGRIRKGLEFDGKDDYVRTIPDLSPPLSSQEMTGCAWIKIDTVSGIEAPLRDGILMGHFYYFHLWVNSDGTFHFGAQTLISGVSTYEFLDSTNSFPFGVWT
ncbi:MAG: class III signal peptide-containing protein, partial [Candidatus Micrarchaeia archaeon]